MGKICMGKRAPQFTAVAVVNNEFKTISLSDYTGRYLVLFFYPADFTFVCSTEIIAFSERIDEFAELNCAVVGVSTDTKYSHFQWIQTPRELGGLGDMHIPIAADPTHRMAKDYNVLKEDEGICYRGLFIIDDKGTVRQITVNDLSIGRSVDEIIRLIQALQHVDKHGDVCPAGWRPGKNSIKPAVESLKFYLSSE